MHCHMMLLCTACKRILSRIVLRLDLHKLLLFHAMCLFYSSISVVLVVCRNSEYFLILDDLVIAKSKFLEV
jgi:hypothetical protein